MNTSEIRAELKRIHAELDQLVEYSHKLVVLDCMEAGPPPLPQPLDLWAPSQLNGPANQLDTSTTLGLHREQVRHRITHLEQRSAQLRQELHGARSTPAWHGTVGVVLAAVVLSIIFPLGAPVYWVAVALFVLWPCKRP